MNKPSFIQPFPYRIEDHMDTVGSSPVTHHVIPETPPWHLVQPEVDLSLTFSKKDSMSALTIRSEFEDALDSYPVSTVFYTDGSKSEDSVARSFFSSRLKLKMKLPVQMSVFTSEIIAILSALKCLEADNEQHQFVICSDSLSAIMAIHGMDVHHPYVLQVLYAIKSISQQEKIVVFMWCPSHVGIPGNEMAHTLAEKALSSTNLAELPVPASDLRGLIKKYIRSQWQHEWEEQHNNKLHSIHPTIGPWPPCQREKRREEIVLVRIV
ncbi:hypothetical protein CAPTEDRAFT_215116 [Capitella teleta]|uniref:RNase H type-1 domain-containing protein n=1 Tax=Capitella teleta TaxID=283909 RepID=R7UK32_CAPTE|nr:hypothetical protein CAPTEDRAFT_215116 [Capitella teleta]|eukprot:ELU06453.1 hypothetical protein CAPTEDRAFT_215116 [Capitella teleta]